MPVSHLDWQSRFSLIIFILTTAGLHRLPISIGPDFNVSSGGI
jgi:hypothetical protein